MRTGLRIAVLGCLAGAGLVLLALSRPWLTARIGAAPPLPGRTVTLTGSAFAPGARALGLVGLAGVAALPATRRWGRAAVGALLVLAGAGIVVVVARVLSDPASAARGTEAFRTGFAVTSSPSLGAWPYVAILGGVLLLSSGALAVLRGRGWAAMGERYEAPAAPKPVGEASLWEALDRGEDPTH